MGIRFKYTGLTATGERITDIIVEQDEVAARQYLKNKGLIVTQIVPEKEKSSLFGASKISANDIEQSTSQLATLLENGVKVNDAIEVLIDTSTSQALALVWKSVHEQVQAGESLHAALSEYPEYFDVLYIEMVNIAEQTGAMPKVFNGLAENLAFQRELRSKTIQALIYPMIILFVCVTAIFSIFNFVIPNMEAVFASAEELPGYTEWLLNSSKFVSENNFPILVSVLALIAMLISGWQNPNYRKKMQDLFAVMPLSRVLIAKAEQIRFCSAMHLTLHSGVNLSRAIELSAKTLSWIKNREQLEQVKNKVDAGSSLADSLEDSRVLDKVSVSLIKVGEQSGTLSSSFAEVSKRVKTDFESWVMKMTSLLEPLLILVMGAIVGGVVIIMLLSIVSVNDLSI